jgi:hypothetical protein
MHAGENRHYSILKSRLNKFLGDSLQIQKASIVPRPWAPWTRLPLNAEMAGNIQYSYHDARVETLTSRVS